jgi:hypothetical protein
MSIAAGRSYTLPLIVQHCVLANRCCSMQSAHSSAHLCKAAVLQRDQAQDELHRLQPLAVVAVMQLQLQVGQHRQQDARAHQVHLRHTRQASMMPLPATTDLCLHHSQGT